MNRTAYRIIFNACRGQLMVSCPSVRNTFGVRFQPLFFQRPASQGWSLIGLRHFFNTALCLLFAQNLPLAQALPLPLADSAVGFDMNGCLDWSTS